MEKKEKTDIVRTLVETIGLGATQRLVQEFGGKQLRIPDGSGRTGTFSTWLDEALGIEAARKLRAMFGGESITVPKLHAQTLAARDRLIVADYDGGLPMIELIRKYSLTQRQIRTILCRPAGDDSLVQRVVDDRQLGLF